MRAINLQCQTHALLLPPCRALLIAVCQHPNLSQTSHYCTDSHQDTPCSVVSRRPAPRAACFSHLGFSGQRLAGMTRSTRLKVTVGCGRHLLRQIGVVCCSCHSMRYSAEQCQTVRTQVGHQASLCLQTARNCWLHTCPARPSVEQCRSFFCKRCYMAKLLCRCTC
eukprot:COSAG02_NODE_416_length_22749_cov_21.264059_10_plen_166_part_00